MGWSWTPAERGSFTACQASARHDRRSITGANRGIGREVARQLAARGDTAVLTARDLAKAQAAAAEVGARPAQLDVTDPDSVERFASEVPEVDVLVNNAAIHYDTWERARSADLDVVREALETNLLGAWRRRSPGSGVGEERASAHRQRLERLRPAPRHGRRTPPTVRARPR